MTTWAFVYDRDATNIDQLMAWLFSLPSNEPKVVARTGTHMASAELVERLFALSQESRQGLHQAVAREPASVRRLAFP